MSNGERHCHPSISTICASRTLQQTASTSGTSTGHDQIMLDNPADFEDVHSLCILDANTFEALHVYELNRNEAGMSICSAVLADDPNPYYAVGTSYIEADATESRLVLHSQGIDCMRHKKSPN